MKSIISYPNRGSWGDNKYRGNCSGHVIMDLLEYFQPEKFVEVFAGGGTGFDVARSMGYNNSIHLDLNGRFGTPFNALTDPLPTGSDFVFSHPPYHDIVQYSGNVWGDSHPDDLSKCRSYVEFIHKLNIVNAKIFNSLVNGGRHATLVGDVRKNGVYYSLMKDMAFYGDLESHIIKAQHNCHSDRQTYSNTFIPIVHEHLIILRKNQVWAIPIAATKRVIKNIKDSALATWRDLVQAALQQLKGTAKLADLYELLQDTEKAKGNVNFKAKIRQVLQLHDEFEAIDRGIWRLTY